MAILAAMAPPKDLRELSRWPITVAPMGGGPSTPALVVAAAEAGAPAAHPEINNATRPLRAAAAASGDADRMSLWAGQAFRGASDRSAGEIVERLAVGAGRAVSGQ